MIIISAQASRTAEGLLTVLKLMVEKNISVCYKIKNGCNSDPEVDLRGTE